jgi:hypothetical protein
MCALRGAQFVNLADTKRTPRSRDLKLSLGRISAVAIAALALSTGACAMEEDPVIGSSSDELGGLLFGQPVDLYFDSYYGSDIEQVVVKVANGWLNSEAFDIEVTVTSQNGLLMEHGTAALTLTKDDLFVGEDWEGDKGYAYVSVPGSLFSGNHQPDDAATGYFVSVQIHANGSEVGDPMTGTFLP